MNIVQRGTEGGIMDVLLQLMKKVGLQSIGVLDQDSHQPARSTDVT